MKVGCCHSNAVNEGKVDTEVASEKKVFVRSPKILRSMDRRLDFFLSVIGSH